MRKSVKVRTIIFDIINEIHQKNKNFDESFVNLTLNLKFSSPSVPFEKLPNEDTLGAVITNSYLFARLSPLFVIFATNVSMFAI